MKRCICEEGFTIRLAPNGEQITGELEPTYLNAHDCGYIKMRNALVPIADDLATRKYPSGAESMERSRFFCATMERLARENIFNEEP
jgi:hypothetical protein